MGHIATTACLVAMMFSAQSSTHLPWTFPSDVRERMRMADLVVSGTIEDTSVLGIQIVDDTELTGNLARVRVDRVSAVCLGNFPTRNTYLPSLAERR
jgi:hypothetical protein